MNHPLSDDSIQGRYKEIVKELQNKHANDLRQNVNSSRYMNNDIDRSESDDGKLVRLTLAYSPRNLPVAANLSAQIMNISYKDLKEDILVNRRESPRSKIITKFDIFQRIKEAYNACSCRVCECITNAFAKTRNEQCGCEPCDCDDCKAVNIHTKFYGTQISCVSCARINNAGTTCRGIIKNTHPTPLNDPLDCKCKPCDCIKCAHSFTNPCQCKPCQCIECKSRFVHRQSTVIVAPIAVELERSVCDCQPCECTNCGHGFAEMSTGINRHPNCNCENCNNDACEPDGNNLCKCQRLSKIIKKPVQRDTQEFDIRRASVPKKSLKIDGRNQGKTYRRNAIAMFASVSNVSAKYSCRCDCLVCKCRNNITTPVKRLKYANRLYKVTTIPAINSKFCPGKVCYSYNKNKCGQEKKLETFERVTNCKCDVCECLKCEDVKKRYEFNEVAIKNSNKDKYEFEKDNQKYTPMICTGDIYHSNNCKCQRCFRNTTISEENTKESTSVVSLFHMVKRNYFPIVKEKQRGKPDLNLKDAEHNIKNNTSVNLLNIDIDFKRAQNALEQAKAVSFELLKMLAKYEKANTTFESIFLKLSNFHANCLNEGIGISENFSADKHKLKKLKFNNESSVNRIGTRPVNSNMTPLKDNQNPKSTSVHDSIAKDSLSFLNKFKSNKAIASSVLCTNTEERYVNNEMENSRDERRITGDNMNTVNNINETSTKTRYNEDRYVKNERLEFRRKHKMYRKLINRAVCIVKRTKLKKLIGIKVTVATNISEGSLLKYSDNCNQKITNHTTLKEMQGLKIQSKYSEFVTKKSIVNISVASSYNLEVSNISDNCVIQAKDTYVHKCKPVKDLKKNKLRDDLDSLKILKKNYNWNTKPLMRNKGISNFPFFDVDTKEALNSISLQTNCALFENKKFQSDIDYKVEALSENTSLSVATSQTYSTLNSIDKEVNCTFGTNSMSTKSSCDTLKVCSISVRRVSDHTVLLKWNVPKVTTDVQGYELLMDGRSVQTFGPLRSMAVVTCLPHADKLVFTVRTLTTAISQYNHYPSASIVYRPRVK